MDGINLLPVWYRNKTALDALIKKTAVTTAVIIMLPIIFYACLARAESSYEAELAALTAELGDVKYELSERVRRELTETEAAAEFAEFAFSTTGGDLAENIKTIYAAVPEGIEAAELNYRGETGRFGLSGAASDAGLLPGFIAALGADFFDVSLVKLNAAAGGGCSFAVEFYGASIDGAEVY